MYIPKQKPIYNDFDELPQHYSPKMSNIHHVNVINNHRGNTQRSKGNEILLWGKKS